MSMNELGSKITEMPELDKLAQETKKPPLHHQHMKRSLLPQPVKV